MKDFLVAVHQPNFLPWLGFFDKINKADIFVLLDDVQYPRRSWSNRVRIKGAGGEQWLSVPVKVKGRFEQSIAEAEIDYGEDWVRTHLETLQRNYGKYSYFDQIWPSIASAVKDRHALLCELNVALIETISRLLQIDTPMCFSSQSPAKTQATKRLIHVVKAVGGKIYLSGNGAQGYQEDEEFAVEKIGLCFQQFSHPEYPQRSGDFVAGLSIFDVISSWGLDATQEFLRGSKKTWSSDQNMSLCACAPAM